jgi:hypothetical protein
MGLRCSDGVIGRPYSYSFVQLNVSCEGKFGIIVTQVFGTLFWCASETEHTSTVDRVEFYNAVAASFRIPSPGAVIVHQLKLLSDRLRTFVYISYMLLTCALLSRWAISDEDCEENPENVISDLLGHTQITLAIMGPNLWQAGGDKT